MKVISFSALAELVELHWSPFRKALNTCTDKEENTHKTKQSKIGEKREEERKRPGERRQRRYVTVNVRLRTLTNPITQLLGMHSLCQELSFNQGSNFLLQAEGSYLCRSRTQWQALRMETGLILVSTKHSFTATAFPQRSSTAAMTSAHTARQLEILPLSKSSLSHWSKGSFKVWKKMGGITLTVVDGDLRSAEKG